MISWPQCYYKHKDNWRFYYPCPDISCHTISNKESLTLHEYKGDPVYTIAGWDGGYSFKRFWSNCYFLLGELGGIDGIQQLVHHYYLQNGSLGSAKASERIKKFLGNQPGARITDDK